MTYWVLLLIGGLFVISASFFAATFHPWYASDGFCVALGCAIGMIVRAIEGDQ